MALGPVSFSGVASGLDIKSIITAILNAEHRPVDLLQARQSGIDARRSAFNELTTTLTALRSALQELASPGTLNARSAGSTDAGIVTATASQAADPGTH